MSRMPTGSDPTVEQACTATDGFMAVDGQAADL
jgi:hypothetical protein